MNNENNPSSKNWLKSSVSVLVFLIIFSFFISISHRVVIVRNGFLAEVLPRVLIDLTNNNRLALNVNQLKSSPVLEEAARLKANDMAEKGYFDHYSPEGLSPWSFMERVDYDFVYAGENLAVYFSDSEDVVNAWMNSPDHRDNILNQNFTEIGIATARGKYKGEDTIFVVQMFGKPNFRTASANASQAIVQDVVTAGVVSTNNDNKTINDSISTESPEVLGIATSDTDNQKFLAVEKVTKPTVVSAVSIEEINGDQIQVDNEMPSNEIVLGENVSYKYSSPTELLLTSPSLLLTIIYVSLVVVIIFLVLTALLFELRRHHYLHVLSGLGLLILILIMYFAYQSFFGDRIEIDSLYKYKQS